MSVAADRAGPLPLPWLTTDKGEAVGRDRNEHRERLSKPSRDWES